MKKGQIFSGKVIGVDFPNKGIIDTDEGMCVVKNTLPGQQITFMVNKVKKGKPEGRLLSVDVKSPREIPSPCPHFGVCGGCVFLTLPYEEQLHLKADQVKKLLEGVGERQGDYPWEGIKASPCQFGYRNKMEFSFGDEEKDGPLTLGMHKRGSFYDVVSTEGCRIVDEDYRHILSCTKDYFTGFRFYHRMKKEGYLRHLLVRKAVKTGEILVALVTTSQEEHDLMPWKERLTGLSLTGKISGILHVVNDSVADVIKSERLNLLYGRDWFYEEILGMKFKISAFSFFQTNSLGAEVLYRTARDFIGEISGAEGKKPVIYDLYSGTGTIAQMMAPVAGKVIGVEIVEEAVRSAWENAELNGLHNVEFVQGDVLHVLDGIEEKPDFIILDPPRDGVHPKALKKIIDFGVNRLLYISCKPTSLMRDLREFLDAGYVVERAAAVDMFPGTVHVECVCLMTRNK